MFLNASLSNDLWPDARVERCDSFSHQRKRKLEADILFWPVYKYTLWLKEIWPTWLAP